MPETRAMVQEKVAAATNIMVVPSMEFHVRRFHGDGLTAEIEEFTAELFYVWKSSADFGIEERRRLLWSCLGEEVKLELLCHEHNSNMDPEETLALLKELYGEHRTCAQLMRVLDQVQQAPQESIRAYSHRLITAFRALTNRQQQLNSPVSDRVFLRDYFVENLYSPRVRRQAKNKVFDNPQIAFTELRDFAIRLAEDEEQEASYLDATSLPTPSSTLATLDQLEERLLNRMMVVVKSLIAEWRDPRPTKCRRRKLLCYSCREEGHIANSCPTLRVSPGSVSHLVPQVDQVPTIVDPPSRASAAVTPCLLNSGAVLPQQRSVPSLHLNPGKPETIDVPVLQEIELDPLKVHTERSGTAQCLELPEPQVKTELEPINVGDQIHLKLNQVGKGAAFGPTVFLVTSSPSYTDGYFTVVRQDGKPGKRKVVRGQMKLILPSTHITHASVADHLRLDSPSVRESNETYRHIEYRIPRSGTVQSSKLNRGGSRSVVSMPVPLARKRRPAL